MNARLVEMIRTKHVQKKKGLACVCGWEPWEGWAPSNANPRSVKRQWDLHIMQQINAARTVSTQEEAQALPIDTLIRESGGGFLLKVRYGWLAPGVQKLWTEPGLPAHIVFEPGEMDLS